MTRIVLTIGLVFVAIGVIHRIRARHSVRMPMPVVERMESSPTGPDAAATLREMTHAPTPDKTWVGEGDQSTRDTRFIVGRTRKPAVTEIEALHEARLDTITRVMSAVEDAIHPSRLDQKLLADRVTNDVMAGRFELDRVAEKFDRPYGQVWTEAVLIDLSPDKMKPAVADYRHQLTMNRNNIRTHWVGFGAIAVLALFGYTLSNAITRGYFMGRLRVMAVLVIALSAAALV